MACQVVVGGDGRGCRERVGVGQEWLGSRIGSTWLGMGWVVGMGREGTDGPGMAGRVGGGVGWLDMSGRSGPRWEVKGRQEGIE